MMLLIVVTNNAGRVVQAEVHDVQNEASWQEDGGLLLEDGRLHVYGSPLYMFDIEPLVVSDVLNTYRFGKYFVSGGQLCVDEDWQPPVG